MIEQYPRTQKLFGPGRIERRKAAKAVSEKSLLFSLPTAIFLGSSFGRYTRENCNYSFAELGPTVLAGLESVSLRMIRLANRSRRWIDSYINGLNDKQKEFVEQQK